MRLTVVMVRARKWGEKLKVELNIHDDKNAFRYLTATTNPKGSHVEFPSVFINF